MSPGTVSTCFLTVDCRGQAGQRGPIQLDLDGGRYDTLFLEIEEGDNAPLTLEKALAVVSVPRVVFKLNPKEDGYRLLFGNEQAQSPRYDIQSLRRESAQLLCGAGVTGTRWRRTLPTGASLRITSRALRRQCCFGLCCLWRSSGCSCLPCGC